MPCKYLNYTHNKVSCYGFQTLCTPNRGFVEITIQIVFLYSSFTAFTLHRNKCLVGMFKRNRFSVAMFVAHIGCTFLNNFFTWFCYCSIYPSSNQIFIITVKSKSRAQTVCFIHCLINSLGHWFPLRSRPSH